MAVIYRNVNISNHTFINNNVNVISNVARQIIVCPRRIFLYSPFNFSPCYFELINVSYRELKQLLYTTMPLMYKYQPIDHDFILKEWIILEISKYQHLYF